MPPLSAEMSAPAPGQAVTAVLLVFDRRELACQTVAAILAQTTPPERVIVVDNGSRDGSADAVAARFPTVEVIALAENGGVGAGHNAGWRAALADPNCAYIWTLEQDCLPHPTCLAELLAAHRSLWPNAEKAGVVLPFQENPAALSPQPHLVVRGLRLIRLHNLPRSAPPAPRRHLTFNAALLPVELVRTVGLLDESFFIYCEDIDFSRRCQAHGRSIRLVPAARVDHDLFRDSLRRQIGPWVFLGPGRAGLTRVYYGFRNHLALDLRTRGRWNTLLRHLLAYALLQLWDLGVAHDRRTRLRLRTRALRDGWTGRLGRTDDPRLSRPSTLAASSHPPRAEVRA